MSYFQQIFSRPSLYDTTTIKQTTILTILFITYLEMHGTKMSLGVKLENQGKHKGGNNLVLNLQNTRISSINGMFSVTISFLITSIARGTNIHLL